MSSSFERKLNRKALKRAKRFIQVTVLNDPTRKMEVPILFRDYLLESYQLRADMLVGLGFHIVFVVEGVVFGMISKHEEQARVTLHVLELDNEKNQEMVGSEIYRYWQSLPSALTFEELKNRYSEVAGATEGNRAS